VATQGFHAATIDRVAREAGVTRTLIYMQFGDLAGMVEALVERESAIVQDGLERALLRLPRNLSPVDAAIAAARVMLEEADAAPVSWQILVTPPEGGPPELHDANADGRELCRRFLAELIGRVTDGMPDPVLTTDLLYLIGDELVRLHLADPREYPTERLLDQVGFLVGALARAAQSA